MFSLFHFPDTMKLVKKKPSLKLYKGCKYKKNLNLDISMKLASLSLLEACYFNIKNIFCGTFISSGVSRFMFEGQRAESIFFS